MPIKHPYVPLTEIQHNALMGSMLGDGHLCKGKSNINAGLMISRAIKDEDYLQYEMKIFDNFLPSRHKDKALHLSPDGTQYSFGTIVSPSFTSYHSTWYQNIEGKRNKVVPSDLKLNGQIIAHWICDDGSVLYNKLPYRFVVEFSTHGFTQDEVSFLAKSLSDRYNEEFLVRAKNRKEKRYYIIKAYDSACRVMFSDIDPYFKMMRKRLWDKPESRFYSNPPERQTSKKKDFAKRKELVRQLVNLGQDCKLLDVAMQLGFVRDDRIDYTSVNRFLEPYLANGSITKHFDNYDNNICTIKIVKK